MNRTTITIRPIDQTDGCKTHTWPTDGLAVQLILAMRRRGGINVCRECIERARGDAKRRAHARP